MRKPIAIIGMGAILPDAMCLSEYWSNILTGKDSIRDIPQSYWDIGDFYDPDPTVKDKSYSYKAGAISAIEFDSVGYGIPPTVMESISVEQLYALVVARQALLDADMIGKNAKPFNKNKTGVVLATGIGKNAFSLSRRQDIPRTRRILKNSGVPDEIAERVIQRLLDVELEWTENSEPGYLSNVTAGRISNRFDFNGTNCVVDAACASGIAVLKVASYELNSGDCDIVLAGGVNLDLAASTFVSFSKTPAISKNHISRPFDAEADGMMLGDGVAMVVLKRLEDAERDNDRIYAVIKSVGSSGDGRAKSVFAPSVEGQLMALERAYEKTDVDPATVTLIEAHGTSTHIGDGCELNSLTKFFGERGAKKSSVVIGSIKSQIGHTRLVAGLAGLIKASIAIYSRTLPPTINVSKDRSEIADSPFYTIAKPKPWITGGKYPIRRAGLCSCGFGGTNYHAVLEEYVGKASKESGAAKYASWRRIHRIPVGICIDASSVNELITICEGFASRISEDKAVFDMLADDQLNANAVPENRPRLGFVADGPDEAARKLLLAVETLRKNVKAEEFRNEKESIYFRAKGLPASAKTMTLFPGQGVQYIGMFDELARDYPEISDFLSLCGSALELQGLTPISDIIYSAGAKRALPDPESMLKDTKYTQPALAAICGGAYEVLRNRGYTEDFLIGHSFGEITGLWAGGAIDAKTFAQLAVARGVAISSGTSGTGMITIQADRKECEKWIKSYNNLYIANENCNAQTAVSGDIEQINALEAALTAANVSCKVLNVTQAFHSPYMEQPNTRFRKALDDAEFSDIKKAIYSCPDAKPYSKRASSIKKTLSQQLELPIRFSKSIEHAYENGARVFVEVGPGKVLTNLVHRILEGKEYYAVSIDGAGSLKRAHVQLEEALVWLRALGLKIGGDLYRMRSSEIYKDEKPKSSYLIDPVVYMTPAKWAVVEKALYEEYPTYKTINDPDANLPTSAAISTDRENNKYYTPDDFDNGGGELRMEKGALESIVGLQSLNGQALEKFLASQGYQIGVFTEMLKKMESDSGVSSVLRLVETFQNNSMRAYDSYMLGQQGILAGFETGAGLGQFAQISPQLGSSMPEQVVQRGLPDAPKPVQIQEPLIPAPVASVISAPAPAPVATQAPASNAAVAAATPVSVSNIQEGVADTAFDLESFDPVQTIISIISDKTGYPEEMVDAEMSIESDLGIDSIKRIEVFSELTNHIPGGFDKEDIETISMLHTIQEIGDYIIERVKDLSKKKISDKQVNGQLDIKDTSVQEKVAAKPDLPSVRTIKRYQVGIGDAAPESEPVMPVSSGLIVISADEDGVAEHVAQRVQALGYQSVIVALESVANEPDSKLKLKSKDAIVKDAFNNIVTQSNQPLAGFIHIASKRATVSESKPFPKVEMEALKTIFLCAKHFFSYFKQETGKGFFVSATRMDGHLGLEARGNVVQGGLFGLHKSLSIEWAGTILSKAVDLDAELPPDKAAEYLVSEIFNAGYKNAEVGISADGSRSMPVLTESYPDTDLNDNGPGKNDVLLVSGGGRGITAQCVIKLAEKCGCSFIIVGRTDISTDISWTEGFRDKAKIRKLAIGRLTKINSGVKPKPSEVDRLVEVVFNQIEVMDTLEAVRAAGSKVNYVACDICDSKKLNAALKASEKEMGRITGFVHGAGNIADKKIQRKTAEDFDYVFGSKIDGLDTCLSYVNKNDLKYLTLFSSIAGYFGNSGQSDYAMANEVMNKFVHVFRREHPTCKTVAVNWGAWDAGSMISPSIRNAIKGTDLDLIPVETGTQYFVEQFLSAQGPSDCQIVINGSGNLVRPDVKFPGM